MKLLDAVDLLTLPQSSWVTQTVGKESTRTKVTLDSLLTQLEGAIRGTVGIGGSGSLPHQRNMLDADSLTRFMVIGDAVKAWARGVGIITNPDATTGTTLRAWYVVYSLAERGTEDYYMAQLLGWAREIQATLDPPRVMDLPDRCPNCKAVTYSKEGAQMLRPLVVMFREGDGLLAGAKGSCRACGTRWGARELAYAIEEDSRQVPA